MKKIFAVSCILGIQLLCMQPACAYLLPVPAYSAEGSLYLETDSIVRKGSSVALTFIESFNQPKSYGSLSYLSKATDIILDCSAGRIFAVAERFYSDPNLQGSILGNFALYDQFGSTPVADSWNAYLLNMGCATR
jgi:hypothetical protein